MKTSLLIIFGIIVVIAVSLSSFAIYESSTITLIACDPRYTQIDGKCVLRNLEQKIEKVVADAEDDPNKIGHNYVRLVIDSDIFSHNEKLLVIEKYVKEKNISTPFTENVITGKQEFESDEPITFTWKQFGIGHPCTDLSIQVQSKSSDKPFYEHESQRLCQVLDEDVTFLQTWAQDDFPDFPYCSEWGEYVIKVKNMFGEFGVYHEYFCKGPSVGNDVINTEPEMSPPPEPTFDSKEHYTIEITGLKDVYLVGERYDFSYIISGYGYICGGKEITFPDQNGEIVTIASSASCIAGLQMNEFVFDIQKEYGTTYGHTELKNPGTYTVTVTFDRPSQDFPTTAIKEFRVPPINSWYNNQLRDTDLQTVIDSCANDSPKERMRDGLRYMNETHVFLNLGCEWQKIGKYMGD